MSSHQNPAANLTAEQQLEVVRSVASVCRTGQWLSGKVATDAERATCRKMLRQFDLAMRASGVQVAL